jgi:deoxyhypusine synthase
MEAEMSMENKHFDIRLRDPDLIQKKKELFSQPIQPVKVNKGTTIRELIDSFEKGGFQSRALADCARIFCDMLQDSERPTILMGISGSLIAAGMRQVLVDMIENNMIDVLVSTGAIIGQDHYQVLGGKHYKGSPNFDDRVLRDLYIDRLYDTFMCEEKYWEADQYISDFCERLAGKTLSSRQFVEALGKERAVDDPNSILGACIRNNVPLFIPALNDSSIGIGITQHHHLMRKSGREPLAINGMMDNYELTQIVNRSKTTSAVYISGGVPKNYINDSVVMTYIFNRDTGGHKYAIQLTLTGPQDGGLSGSTLAEATSWGKVSKKATHRMAYTEVSIGLPLVYGYALQTDASRNRKKLNFRWEGDKLLGL